jgi:apolipoprotein N-acyltransferase
MVMDDAKPITREPLRWRQGTLFQACLGSTLLFLSFPPFDLWPLAWFALIPWLRLIVLQELPGRRSWLSLYAAGFLFWGVILYWLTLPHVAGILSWLALPGYLAFYTPAFVGICRALFHRWRMPLPIVVPLVWMGLEHARTWILTGFSMAGLGHTQWLVTPLIQCADLAGAALVSGIVTLPSAVLVAWWYSTSPRRNLALIVGSLGTAAIITAAWLYGNAWLREPTSPILTVGLIQGDVPSYFDERAMTTDEVMNHYGRLTEILTYAWRERTTGKEVPKNLGTDLEPNVALTRDRLRTMQPLPQKIELLVWPESMYRVPPLTFVPKVAVPSNMQKTPAEIEEYYRSTLLNFFRDRAPVGTAILAGSDRLLCHSIEPQEYERFNSAFFIDQHGTLQVPYDKRHLVPFGEFIPFGSWMPWIYSVSHLSGGLSAGEEARSYDIVNHAGRTVRICPNICYETVMPQVIRAQMLELAEQNKTPEVLVSVTNDGWFFGSSELDLHLRCGVFRAIEARRSLLIAANTGFSGNIDPAGRILEQGARQKPDVLLVNAMEFDSPAARELSLYLRHGEWLGKAGWYLICIVTLAEVVFWWRNRNHVTQPLK